MLTKYFLHTIDGNYELQQDDLLNWDEIRCSYKRSGYDGVVRSFTSQFRFVNNARNIILGLYRKDRFNAKATLSVHTMNNKWEYEKCFECPLDFSTIEWEGHSLKINCLDNNLASIIKANKSTKYEFLIGEDINPDRSFVFDRLPMTETLTYEFTGGDSEENGDITVTFRNNELPYMGYVAEEIVIGRVLDWNDDQTNEGSSYLFKAEKTANINLDYNLSYMASNQGTVELQLQIVRGESVVRTLNVGTIKSETIKRIVLNENKAGIPASGLTPNLPSDKLQQIEQAFGTLPDPDSVGKTPNNIVYAVFEDSDHLAVMLWECVIVTSNPDKYDCEWRYVNQTEVEFLNRHIEGSVQISLSVGEIVRLKAQCTSQTGVSSDATAINVRLTSSAYTFSWTARDTMVNIEAFEPLTVLRSLLDRMGDSPTYIIPEISRYDERIAKTLIFSAESARGINGARFYSSFNEFCEWMETVFGYIYQIEDPEVNPYQHIQFAGSIQTQLIGLPNFAEGAFTSVPLKSNIAYFTRSKRFYYWDAVNGLAYSRWQGCENYNDPETGYVREDTLFRFVSLGNINLYSCYENGQIAEYPVVVEIDEGAVGHVTQKVRFFHRSELFKDEKPRSIDNARDIKYNIDTSRIFSSITIGYDKKDYDSLNGRDEFNFNNTYSTGCQLSDKTLSLISKYRADSYGIEFAVQKRGKDTTDSTSDQDVFFVLCEERNGVMWPDRTLGIENSISDFIFNAAFSPISCVKANAGYLGLQSDVLKLKFASSTGNSAIIIGGEALSSDIEINTPIATCATIEFTTGDIDDIADVNEIIEVSDGEMVYRGFLSEVDIKYARQEAMKYKLIVKEIEPC